MNVEFRKSLRRKKTSTAPPPSVERDVNAEINLKGWLYRLEGSPLKHWKKRWCVLAQHALFIYKEEDEQKLITSLLLPGYTVRVCTSHDKVSHKNAFVAEHETLKSYYLAADSNAAMCQWRNSMAQAAAAVQAPAVPDPPQPVYDRDYGRYVDMNSLTCVTRSPIYANAPPKPKRLSPRDNRPRSADFLSHPEQQRSDGLCSLRPDTHVRPHTSMRLFDPPACESNNNNSNYCPSFGQSVSQRELPPMAHSRPRSCLAEPLPLSTPSFDQPPHSLPAQNAFLNSHQQQQQHRMFHASSSPSPFMEKPHDIYGTVQPPHCHPYSLPPCQEDSPSTMLQSRRMSRTSTSASSTPPLRPPITNQEPLYSARVSFRAHSLHNMNSLQSSTESHRPPQSNGMNGYSSSTTSLKGNVLSEATTTTSSYSYDALDARTLPNRNTPPSSLPRPIDKYLYNNPMIGVDRAGLRVVNMNQQYPVKKTVSGRTLSTASSTTNVDDIQPSKLEVYRQVPQPSYFTRPANDFISGSQQNRCVNDALNDRRDYSLQSASSRDLQSLQSLTDSQYSTAPPESSLPSLESNSSDLHAPSPVQHFTNLPPYQLRQRDLHHKVFEPRAAPPRYSEACLRSEIMQKTVSNKGDQQMHNHTPPVRPPIQVTPPSPLSQQEMNGPVTPRIPNSRKLLFDQNGLSPMKTPLVEKNAPEDPYSYGREDLRKASQMFYNSRITGVINPDYRNPPTLDLSFQSSSHSSVFEHDTPTIERQPSHNDIAVDQHRSNLAHLDSSNYAIRKQEIEGSKVIPRNEDASSSASQIASNAVAARDCAPRSSDSVMSGTAREPQNSLGFAEQEKDSAVQCSDARFSPEHSATQAPKENSLRYGNVSEKLAFFESKKSSESLRPKSAMSNGSGSSGATARPVPDLIDELRDSDSRSCSRMASNYVCSASSDDILRTITASKHQRSLSLLDRPAPDVVPTQTPPYYYSDLSLSAQSSQSRVSRDCRDDQGVASSASHIVASSSCGQMNGQQKVKGTSPRTPSERRLEWQSQDKPKPMVSARGEANNAMFNGHSPTPVATKKQSRSCENLLKNQLLKVPEATQSATCLLESEPFYENIGFGCKTTGKSGPEPQTLPAKISFLAAKSAGTPKKTASVDEPHNSPSSQQRSSKPSDDSRERNNQQRRNGSTNEQCEDNDECYEAQSNEMRQSNLPPSSGPPDLIQSALNSSGDVGEHGNEIFAQILNSISCPSKIDIPERYVSESDSEADFSASERLARYHKADSIQRRLVGQFRDDVGRLTMNQIIAKQAKHARKILATQH